MFSSFLEKAKEAVKDAAGKVKTQANGMAKLLQSRVHVTGDGSYLVNPEQHILQLTKGSNRRQHPAVFAMKCPVEKAVTVCTGQVELATVATHLNNRLGTRYLIINLSDLPYDCSAFRGDLLEFFFPGYPAPPIKTIVQMCVAIDEWVQKQYAASDMQRKLALPATAGGGAAHDMPAPTPKAAGGFARVGSGGAAEQQAPPAVLFHCRTGKGRTAVALSCYLAWAGVLPSPMEALDHVCAGLAMPVEMATIPSQRRYVEYFTNILDGAKPAARKLILSRVIVHSVPRFGVASPGTVDRPGRKGCHPELRIVKNGNIVFRGDPEQSKPRKKKHEASTHTGAAAAEAGGGGPSEQAAEMVPSGGAAGGVRASDGGIKFVVDLETQEDVVLSCYHVEPRGTSPGSRWKRVFMFRAQFYTGFVREHMLRFTRTSLDGTSENEALFPDDFFVEAFFESHPVGNDYRLPSAWKAIHHRTRRMRAAEQERAARKAERKRAKAAKKTRTRGKEGKKGKKRSTKIVHGAISPTSGSAVRSDAGDDGGGGAAAGAAARGSTSPLRRSSRGSTGGGRGGGGGGGGGGEFDAQTPTSAGGGGIADAAFYSDPSDSDSTASGASAHAAQQTTPTTSASSVAPAGDFEILFSDGDDDDNDDGGNGQAAIVGTEIREATTINQPAASSSGGAQRRTPATAVIKLIGTNGDASASSAGVEDPAAARGRSGGVDQPGSGAKTLAAPRRTARTEAETPSPGVGVGSTSPSSTATVENSDGWDACAMDADDGVVAMSDDADADTAVDAEGDDADGAALADIESFLSSLEPM